MIKYNESKMSPVQVISKRQLQTDVPRLKNKNPTKPKLIVSKNPLQRDFVWIFLDLFIIIHIFSLITISFILVLKPNLHMKKLTKK